MATATDVTSSGAIDLSALERMIRDVEVCAVLLPVWLLRKYIAADRGMAALPFRMPHGDVHVIGRARLLEVARSEDLEPGTQIPADSPLILLVRPEADYLSATPAATVLRQYWRLIFHGRIDIEMQKRLGLLHAAGDAAAAPDDAAARQRIASLGLPAFTEARFVLHREMHLHVGASDTEAYGEFVATYLELRHFAPPLVEVYFPSLVGRQDQVDLLAARDVDWASILSQTRLPGAADAASSLHVAVEFAPPEIPADFDEHLPAVEDSAATRARAAGNVVRASILHMRSYRWGNTAGEYARALRDLAALSRRLQSALGFDKQTAAHWEQAMQPLLARAARRWWNPEGRLLYDLQKICLDHEREVYSVGVVEWLLERCRRPLVRAQPNQRVVLACKHLRLALAHLAAVRISPDQRHELADLLRAALAAAEVRLRDLLRRPLDDALDAGGLIPHNAAERAARGKLVDELLDALVHRGFLNFSTLRDAVSRNQMKFHDLNRRPRRRGHDAGNAHAH